MAYNYKKSRCPDRFSDNDYENFTAGLLQWGDDHKTDPDFYPNYADIPPLKAAFDLALQKYGTSKEVADEKHDTMLKTVEPVCQAMIGLRRQRNRTMVGTMDGMAFRHCVTEKF